jgi:predicted ester cyclase
MFKAVPYTFFSHIGLVSDGSAVAEHLNFEAQQQHELIESSMHGHPSPIL